MRIASRGLRVVSVGLVSAVALTGCSGNSTKPTVLPPLTTTATPPAATTPAPVPTQVATLASPTSNQASIARAPSGSPTPQPQPIESASSTAAASFVTNYYSTAAKALHSKKALATWKTMFLSSCDRCEADYAGVSKNLAAGTRYEGGAYHLVSREVTVVEAAGAVVDVTLYVTAGKAFNAKGDLIAEQKQTPVQGDIVTTQYTDSHWYVYDIRVIK